MRRSPKSPKEPSSWTPVWEWFRYAALRYLSLLHEGAVIVKLQWPWMTCFPKRDILWPGPSWKLKFTGKQTENTDLFTILSFIQIFPNTHDKIWVLMGNVSTMVLQLKTISETLCCSFPRNLSSLLPKVTIYCWLSAGECWGLTSAHFPSSLAINATCRHPSVGQDSPGALSSVDHLNRWKDADRPDEAPSWHPSDVGWVFFQDGLIPIVWRGERYRLKG